jgi:ADP-ribosyl-[dinitrogen reductase] hydrolase
MLQGQFVGQGGRRFSPVCYITDAFPASLYLVRKFVNDFESSIIANASVGGDNCHRGAVVGALLGAGARSRSDICLSSATP